MELCNAQALMSLLSHQSETKEGCPANTSGCAILLQGAMRALRTPCIQAFLHLLPAVGMLWVFVDVAPLTAGLARGVAPTAAISALQVRW